MRMRCVRGLWLAAMLCAFSGPSVLVECFAQRAFDRDLRAATTRGPRRARPRGGVRAERPEVTQTRHATSLGAAGPVDQDAPLADAVQRGDKQAVLSLLKKRADVNAPQSDGA